MSLDHAVLRFARMSRRNAWQRGAFPCFALFTLFALALFAPSVARAQDWIAHYNGPANGDDNPVALAVDAIGNVYVTGFSDAGGTRSNADYATVKYNASGVQQWTQRYDGPNDYLDIPVALVVDAKGNVYVTGYSAGTTETYYDYATIKYNSAGAQQWVKRYNGPASSDDYPRALAVDASGNVYVTGYSVVDDSRATYDLATVKYNAAGVQQWAQRYNGPRDGRYYPSAIAVDGGGNVHVTGCSVDIGTDNLAYATVKYNAAGVQQWAQRYNGSDSSQDVATALAMDASGNVYVTGYSALSGTDYDYATIKYNAAGVQQWAQRYSGPNIYGDIPAALAVDPSGNVYVTRHSYGSGTSEDYATVKYNASGVRQWVQRYNGLGGFGDDIAIALAVDASGDVYVTGYSAGRDDGFGTPANDYATIKYNDAGVQQWTRRYNGSADSEDYATALAIDGSGNVYVTGYSYGASRTGYDYETLKYAAPRWSPVDVAVNRTDNTSRLLWRENANRYAVWKLSATGAVQVGKYYGPISGYTCDQIAVAPNGQATLLWRNPVAKQAQLWTLAADLSRVIKATAYAYPTDYTPSYLAADAASNLRLTWRKTNGAVALWTITPANGAITRSAVYGPYQDLVDGSIAVGADGNVRLLWRNSRTGGAVLWTLPSAYGAPTSGYNYTVKNAVPQDLGVGADNKARLQWAYSNSKIAEWKVNTTNGAIESGQFYGPLANVSPLGLSVGGDNQTRQLWAYSNGKAALWTLNDPLTSITSAYTYGPLP